MEDDTVRQEISRLKTKNSLLLQYKKKYEFIENVSGEAVIIFDSEFSCLNINYRGIELFGYSFTEALGKQVCEFFTEEYCKIEKEASWGHKESSFEALMLRKNGEQFWALVYGKSISYDGIEVRALACRDISNKKKMENDILLLRDEYQAIFNNTQVGILLTSSDRIIRRVNQKFVEIMGYKHSSELIGKSIEVCHTRYKSFLDFGSAFYTQLLEGKKVKTEYRFRNSSGEAVWMSVSGSLISKDEHPTLDKGVVWVFEDISDKKLADEKLKAAYHEMEVIFNNSLVGLLMVRPFRKIYKANQVLANIMGFDSPAELEGKSTRILFDSESNFIKFKDKFYPALVRKSLHAGDFQVFRADGNVIWVSVSGKVLDDCEPPNLNVGVIWSIIDITKRKEAEEKLLELSRTDSLTGIYNRRYFYELAAYELEVHKRYGRPFAYAIIDIDHFKMINDTYGHTIGDKALSFFAGVLRKNIRRTDIVGRIGGEEFGICLLEVDLKQALTILNNIRSQLLKVLPDTAEGIPMLTMSVGCVIVSKNEDMEEAVKRADDLLYKAKEQGRDRILIS